MNNIIETLINNHPARAIDMVLVDITLLRQFFNSFKKELINPITNKPFDFEEFLNTKQHYHSKINKIMLSKTQSWLNQMVPYTPYYMNNQNQPVHHDFNNIIHDQTNSFKILLNPEYKHVYGDLGYKIYDRLLVTQRSIWDYQESTPIYNYYGLKDYNFLYAKDEITPSKLDNVKYDDYYHFHQSYRSYVNSTKYQDQVFTGSLGTIGEIEFIADYYLHTTSFDTKPHYLNYVNENDLKLLMRNYQTPSLFWEKLDEEMKQFRYSRPDIFNAYLILTGAHERNKYEFMQTLFHKTNNEKLSFELYQLKTTIKDPRTLLNYLRENNHNIIWFYEYDFNQSLLQKELKWLNTLKQDNERSNDETCLHI